LTALYWLRVVPLLLGCFVPGFLLTITWPKVWAEGLDAAERVLVSLLAGLILVSWFLLFLAQLQVFSLIAVVAGWAAICTALGWIGRHKWQGCSLKLGWSWQAVLLTAILILAAVLFARPAESFLVLDDAGIYTLGGIQLAETGKLFATDPALAALSPEAARELLFTGPIIAQWSRLWGQFFVWNWNRPWVSFGLLHMQRLWVGLFTLFLGRYGGLWVAPTFGVIAALGLYALGRRLF